MPSQATRDPWDFKPVFDLLHALSQPSPPAARDSIFADTLSPASSVTEDLSESSNRRAHLGDFDAIFKYFNKPLGIPPPKIHSESLDEEPLSREFDSTPASSPPDHDPQHFDDFVRTKEVRWTDEVDGASGHRNGRSQEKEGRSEEQDLDPAEIKRLITSNEPTAGKYSPQTSHISRTGSLNRRFKSPRSTGENQQSATDFDSETDDQGASRRPLKRAQATFMNGEQHALNGSALPRLASAKHLLPTWVTPLPAQSGLWPPPAPTIWIDSASITPILDLTREEKKARLVRLLREKFGPDFGSKSGSLLSVDPSRAVFQYGGNNAEDGIHVFVDSSNIAIGFQQSLKMTRGISIHAFTRRAPMSFHSLALIMERGRGVAKRVLVGSSDRSGAQPDYMLHAARCGYEVCSLERVEKYKEDPAKIRARSGNGYGTSGQSSGSEGPTHGIKKVYEQGVDEILHMKMLESIVDAKEPSTIVLATGDAAEAEYSCGFLKNVERALENGWKVELVAWSHSMSHAYKAPDFLEKWKDRFMIVELDDFSEELLGLYVPLNHVESFPRVQA